MAEIEIEGLEEAMNARDRYNDAGKDVSNFDKDKYNLAPDGKIPDNLKDAIKNLDQAKADAEYKRNIAARDYQKHVETVKKSIADKLNLKSDVIKAMNGVKIKPIDIKLEDYDPNNDGETDTAQYHVNKYLNGKLGDLKEKFNSMADGSEDIQDTRGKMTKAKDYVKKILSEMSPGERGLFGASAIFGIISMIGYGIQGSDDKKSVKEFASDRAGCYQLNTQTFELVGPCKCGFTIPYNSDDQGYSKWPSDCEGTDSEGKKIPYDSQKTYKDQVSKLPFCTTNADNSISVCSYTEGACSAYDSTDPGSGSCEVGKCDSKFCTQSPNDKSCKWQNETDPTAKKPITSMAVCMDPSDFVLQMLHFNDTSSDWMPTPTPPLIILISIIGVLLMAITLIWYILFLIRKERKMGKK
jgi:hypothetical protein